MKRYRICVIKSALFGNSYYILDTHTNNPLDTELTDFDELNKEVKYLNCESSAIFFDEREFSFTATPEKG